METKADVRKFRTNLPTYLVSPSTVTITRSGEAIGNYIPTRREHNQPELGALSLAKERLNTMMDERGVSEEDVVADFKASRLAVAA